MIILNFLLISLATVLLVPVLVLFSQALLSVLFELKSRQITTRRPSIAVIIPAHNEQLLIQSTVSSVMSQLNQGDRLIVVADNCTDDTASKARTAGAKVVERFNQQARGKGYALDFGIRACAENPPEVVIIVDADCLIGAKSLYKLSAACMETGRPVQSLYLMKSPEGAGLKTRIAEFAWLVKNLVRPTGFALWDLPCPLMGSGMAFLWKDIRSADLASGHIVEDLKLGIDFCRAGKPPLFLPEAVVTSTFPASAEGLSGQRTRWEHGHLGVILSEAPGLFAEALRSGNLNLLAMAFDLIVPPLALLTLLIVAVFALSAVLYFVSGLILSLWIASTSLALLGLAVMLAWATFGQQVISLVSLCYAPIYALLKIPVYLNFLVKRQVNWVRSKRDE